MMITFAKACGMHLTSTALPLWLNLPTNFCCLHVGGALHEREGQHVAQTITLVVLPLAKFPREVLIVELNLRFQQGTHRPKSQRRLDLQQPQERQEEPQGHPAWTCTCVCARRCHSDRPLLPHSACQVA